MPTWLTFAGYDSWRNWWYNGRLAHAFFGYSKDASARRSAYSAEIYFYVISILYDFTAGRDTARAVRWCASGSSGIVSRNFDIFRHI
jgi:hypothetical protein